jgi:hypothetical protein
VEGYVCALDQIGDGLLPSGPALAVASAIQGACSSDIPQGLTGLVVNLVDAFAPAAAPDAGADAGAPVALAPEARAKAKAEAATIRARLGVKIFPILGHAA